MFVISKLLSTNDVVSLKVSFWAMSTTTTRILNFTWSHLIESRIGTSLPLKLLLLIDIHYFMLIFIISSYKKLKKIN